MSLLPSSIVKKWRSCDRCSLSATRTNVVVGADWTDSDRSEGPLVLVVGEAPGQIEDETGEPFVGLSGELLREHYLTKAGVVRGIITNCCACRPPGNRDPRSDELIACRPRLQEIIDAAKPDLICTVGRIAEEHIKGLRTKVPKISVYHPAYILRQGWPGKKAKDLANQQVLRLRVALAKLPKVIQPEPQETLPADHVKAVKIGRLIDSKGKKFPLKVNPKTAKIVSLPHTRARNS